MGIRNLNKLLQSKCSTALKSITFGDLAGKKIAIDASIYMYRFMGENALLENLYLMISLFRHNNIHPIFVFDGKPPVEKATVIETRKKNKQIAEKEYKELEAAIPTVKDDAEKQEMKQAMDALKKKFIRIKDSDISLVKKLLSAYGVCYMDAHGEADVLCSVLCLKHKVYACVSEDMDLFVYGCPRVIRYMSLLNQTAIIYDMKKILECLDMTMDDFRGICVFSGTDYNTGGIKSLYNTLDYYKQYRAAMREAAMREAAMRELNGNGGNINGNIIVNGNEGDTRNNSNIYDVSGGALEFYEWIDKNVKGIKNVYDLYSVYQMFVLVNNDDISQLYSHELKKLNVCNSPVINKKSIIQIMTKEDFIFVDDVEDGVNKSCAVIAKIKEIKEQPVAAAVTTPTITNKDDDWNEFILGRGKGIDTQRRGHKYSFRGRGARKINSKTIDTLQDGNDVSKFQFIDDDDDADNADDAIECVASASASA